MTDQPAPPVTAADREAFDRLVTDGVPLGRDYAAALAEGRRLLDAESRTTTRR